VSTKSALPTVFHASLEEPREAYANFEASDAPEGMKDWVLVELADRINNYARPKKELEPYGHGHISPQLRSRPSLSPDSPGGSSGTTEQW
jgi:hypothetical protein